VYADNVDILREDTNIKTIKYNGGILLTTSKEMSLQANTNKSNVLKLYGHDKKIKTSNKVIIRICITNKYFLNDLTLKYLGTVPTNTKADQDAVRRRNKFGHKCY
jgi:hypothetical protein